MARSFSRSRGRSSSPRRESLWVDLGASATNLTAAGATLILSANAALLAMRPFTIVRTHMIWELSSDQVVATEVYSAAIAAAVVSDQAVGIGVTAVPTPITDQGSDLFFMWDAAIGKYEFHSDVGVQEVGILCDIDSKAMRRVNDDQDVVFVIENAAAIGTDGSTLRALGRMLVKLH